MKKYTIRYSPAVLNDLDQIWSEVLSASASLEVTEQYINDLRAVIKEKSHFPFSGTPLTYMGEATGIYFVTFKSYIAFYRINGDTMEGGRILFARSDYMKTLFGKSEFTPEDTHE